MHRCGIAGSDGRWSEASEMASAALLISRDGGRQWISV
jgi:hypothetical protein